MVPRPRDKVNTENRARGKLCWRPSFWKKASAETQVANGKSPFATSDLAICTPSASARLAGIIRQLIAVIAPSLLPIVRLAAGTALIAIGGLIAVGGLIAE